MPFWDINNINTISSCLKPIKESKIRESKATNKQSTSLIDYLKPTQIAAWGRSQSPNTSWISSVNAGKFGKSFYNDKSKLWKSKLKQPLAQPSNKPLNKNSDSKTRIPTWRLQTKPKPESYSKLRVPTPTKNWKFILNCKEVKLLIRFG